MPAAIFLFALLVIYGLSRIYLELNDWSVGDVTMATPLAIGIATIVLLVSAFLASRPVPGAVIGMLALVAAAGLTGGAIWAAVHEEEPREVVESPTPPADGTPGPIGAIQVEESDFEIAVEPASTGAGEVTFEVTNSGPSVHNFRLVETDLAPDALPYDDETFQVDESQLDILATTTEFPSGETETVTAQLEPGDYVIFCNVAAHYESGMHAAFTVGPPAGGSGGGEPPPQ
jgi:uncharacterized cupredoxin-like copper-binding protein